MRSVCGGGLVISMSTVPGANHGSAPGRETNADTTVGTDGEQDAAVGPRLEMMLEMPFLQPPPQPTPSRPVQRPTSTLENSSNANVARAAQETDTIGETNASVDRNVSTSLPVRPTSKYYSPSEVVLFDTVKPPPGREMLKGRKRRRRIGEAPTDQEILDTLVRVAEVSRRETPRKEKMRRGRHKT